MPPKPADGEFFHDLAGVVSARDAEEIKRLQESTFKQRQVPIVAVTVERMSDYIPDAQTIESFAHLWFDAWGIGTPEKNDGILVIISIVDRKGRIELGKDWGG
ncbi:MAG: TPM domain-containing protein, partial [Akkermansiaceae bacterium]|nr:TPM domain-containing protein [Akkermansiaceae bacterium]